MARRGRPPKRHDDSMLTHGVIAIVLVTFAIITFLSFFEMAGTLGVILDEWILSFLFGSMRYFVPFIVIILAWYIVADVKYNYRPTHGIGAVLFFIAASSLIHLRFDVDDMWLQAVEGHGGGMFGLGAFLLKKYLGTVASWVILIAIISISVLLLFNTSIMHFFSREAMSKRFAPLKDKLEHAREALENNEEEEDYDGADEEEEDENEEEDEEENATAEAGYFRTDTADEDDDDQDEADEDEDEDEEDDAADVVGSTDKKRHTIALDPVPPWQKNAIIKPLPPVTLLLRRKGKPSSGDIKENQRIIQDTLHEFRIGVTMDDVRTGPTVTQYSFKPDKGVKLSRITALSNDLALALAAHPIRIEAPIPGQSLVGIEVPNDRTALVSLRELIENEVFTKRPHNMMVGLGKDVGGKVWFADLPRMPHLLIAGSTGSGKTVCMNTIITSLLYQNTAADLRMIMVDPKRVELTPYNGIPHLLTPVITNVQKTVNALKWTISEMDRRFELLSQRGNRNITTYNEEHPKEKMPHILFIIDELADLMAMASGDVEAGIIRLAQMARAVGIHLIVATQRPSVDVITGLMKANIPGRIAFSVASITDSRTILDTAGAEKLIGKGDMLLATSDFPKPVRIQGAFISEDETKRVISYLKKGVQPTYEDSVIEKDAGGGSMNMFGGEGDRDELFMEAKRAVVEAEKASASFLQRKLKIGYARAARILDELEEHGVIGPGNGAKARDILITTADIETGEGAGQELTVFKTREPDDTEEEDDTYDEKEEEEEYDDEEEEMEEEEEEEDDDDKDNNEDDEIEEENEEEDDAEEIEEEEEEEEEEDDDEDDEIEDDEEEEDDDDTSYKTR